MPRKKRAPQEVNAGSMADIAFLLLIFFLVTTQISADKGIAAMLPPKQEDQQDVKINERNIFNILVNNQDRILASGELVEISELSVLVKKFVQNRGKDPKSSENPQKAVVSLKTDRGTTYETYITVMDELRKAYNEMKAEYLGLTLEQFNALDRKDPDQKDMIDRAGEEFPVRISDAEPTDVSKLIQ